MSREPQQIPMLDVYVGFGKRRGNDTLHWIFMLAPPGVNQCTWYHVKGGPTQRLPYQLHVEDNKRLDSFGIASRIKICSIPASERRKVLAAANSVPLQRCQRWTTELLGKLERKGLVPPGTHAHFAGRIEISRFEEEGNGSSSGSSGTARESGSSGSRNRTSGSAASRNPGSGSHSSRESGSHGSQSYGSSGTGSRETGSGSYFSRGSGSSSSRGYGYSGSGSSRRY